VALEVDLVPADRQRLADPEPEPEDQGEHGLVAAVTQRRRQEPRLGRRPAGPAAAVGRRQHQPCAGVARDQLVVDGGGEGAAPVADGQADVGAREPAAPDAAVLEGPRQAAIGDQAGDDLLEIGAGDGAERPIAQRVQVLEVGRTLSTVPGDQSPDRLVTSR
jgi:hypothetical protein